MSLERGQIHRSDSAPRLQTLQVSVYEGDVRDDLEHFEPAGLTHCPSQPSDGKGADALVGTLGGADHSVVVAVSDRRIRPRGLTAGDTTLYDGHGNRLDLSSDGADLNCDFVVDGTVDADGYKTDGTAGVSGTFVVTIPVQPATVPPTPPLGVLTVVLKGGIVTSVSGTGVCVWTPGG